MNVVEYRARQGRWTVLSEERGSNGKLRVVCKCDCGTVKSIDSYSFRKGESNSCGCLKRERTSETKTTHGKSKSKTYSIWRGMINRCENPRVKCYDRYGGRGILVCAKWKKFESFLADMGVAQPGMSIERIEVNGNYEPSNCIWIPMVEQVANKRTTLRTTYLGMTKTNAEWEDILGFPRRLIAKRLLNGWTLERAMTQPHRTNHHDR